jgi:hypothetical protein
MEQEARLMDGAVSAAGPLYELRARGLSGGQMLLEIWQLPSPATPRLTHPERTASLKGRTLEIIEVQVLRNLKRAGINLGELARGGVISHYLEEEQALILALLFRALAPMRNTDKIRRVAEEIGKLTREEAGYWLGMAIHRSKPRRVLAALRLLLVSTQ